MATIAFTRRLKEVGPPEEVSYPGDCVGALLNAVCIDFPALGSYILDDQGHVRQHVAIFVDGALRRRDEVLDLPVDDATEVYVMQALSGG